MQGTGFASPNGGKIPLHAVFEFLMMMDFNGSKVR